MVPSTSACGVSVWGPGDRACVRGVVEAAGGGGGTGGAGLLRCFGCHSRVDGSGTVMLWLDLFSP